MKKTVKIFFRHPLITGSSVIFIGSMCANFANFLFNLFMGRWLSPSDYGLLTSLTSIILLFGILQSSLTTIFAKFAAGYSAANDTQSIKSLFSVGNKINSIVIIIILVILGIFTLPLSNFIKIENIYLLVLAYFSIAILTAYALPVGILQGKMKFKLVSSLTVLSPLVKLLLGLLFLFFGFGITGVMVGVFLSIVVAYIVSILPFMKIKLPSNSHLIQGKIYSEIKSYGIPFTLAWFGMMFISSADILMVRHFFDPIVSGQYAALSLMGKVIFYFTVPIYIVFFPLVAFKKKKNERLSGTMLLAFILIAGISSGISIFYFTFPDFVINFFFPIEEYKILDKYLGPFSLYVVLFSLAYLLNNYFLSIGKTNVYKINLLSILIMSILMSIFHSDIMQVVITLFMTTLLLFIMQVYYLFRIHKK